jgi:cyclohexyl-isocyanide hydratase
MRAMTLQIGMLLFPQLTQLDFTGPYEVLWRLPDAQVHIVAKTLDSVPAEGGLRLCPSTTFASAPPIDLLFVPGGWGQFIATDDAGTLDWLRTTGERAKYVASACTGSLLLGAAGLLQGYRATTHWGFLDLLPLVGATPVEERVVVDRNRFTGAGVTAGIDIALTIASELAGRQTAEMIQLQIEYDPAPPFHAGHPRVASAELVATARERIAKRHDARKTQLMKRTK